MNIENETVVNMEMLKRLRESGLDDGYGPVPRSLLSDARKLLRGSGGIASMTPEMKRKLRNKTKRMRRMGVPGY